MKFGERYDDEVLGTQLEGKVKDGYDQGTLYACMKYLKNKNNK